MFVKGVESDGSDFVNSLCMQDAIPQKLVIIVGPISYFKMHTYHLS